MGTKESNLITNIERFGFKVIQKPKTIFVPYGTNEEDLMESMKVLRRDYKYMIQTEIT